MRTWRVIAAGILAISLLMVGGCSAEEPSQPAETPAAEPAGLTGTVWNCYEFAVSGEPMTVLSSAPITAQFNEDGTMGGSSGVNTYSTMFSVDGEALSMTGEIVTTKKAGPEDAMQQEANYLTTLPTATSFNIVGNGDLVLFGPAKNMVARYRPSK